MKNKNKYFTRQRAHACFIDVKLQILLLYLVAYFALCLAHFSFICPIYGFFEWTPKGEKILEALLTISLFAFVLPFRVDRPSDFFVHVHFLLPVVPMLALYSMSDLPRTYMYFVILAYAVVCQVRKFKLPKIKGHTIPMRKMMRGLLIIAAIYILSMIVQGGLRYLNFNLLKVYEFRSDAAENFPAVYEYFSSMLSHVCLPFVFLIAVYCRKWFFAGLALAGSIMMLAMTNHKGPLFYPMMSLSVYYVLRLRRRKIQLFLIGYIFIIVAPLALFYIDNSNIITGVMSFRRLCFVPAQINFTYYDFFSQNPHTMLSESKLTFGLIKYPYDLNSSRLIGYLYFNGSMTTGGANTGWLGSGYMNFGLAGMLIYAFIIGLLLSLVDMLAKNRDMALLGAILFIPFLSLFLSSDLPTTMLNHGFLLALLLVWSCSLERRIGFAAPRGVIGRFFKTTGYSHNFKA